MLTRCHPLKQKATLHYLLWRKHLSEALVWSTCLKHMSEAPDLSSGQLRQVLFLSGGPRASDSVSPLPARFSHQWHFKISPVSRASSCDMSHDLKAINQPFAWLPMQFHFFQILFLFVVGRCSVLLNNLKIKSCISGFRCWFFFNSN